MRTRTQAKADRKQLWGEINRDHKRQAKEKLASLRVQLREARARRKGALRDAKERCRAERIAARERARAMRLRVLEELRGAMRAERTAARQGCSVRLGEARGIKDDIERARAKFIAEEKYQRDLRRIEGANRQRRRSAPRITEIERQAESDDEVRSNIPAEFVALFERVKRSIKGKPSANDVACVACEGARDVLGAGRQACFLERDVAARRNAAGEASEDRSTARRHEGRWRA